MATTVHLKTGFHDDAYWVDWDEWNDASETRFSSGVVADSDRATDREARAVLQDLHDRVAASNLQVRPEGTEVPMLVVTATSGEVEAATGRILQPRDDGPQAPDRPVGDERAR
jgi:hypothetical protein